MFTTPYQVRQLYAKSIESLDDTVKFFASGLITDYEARQRVNTALKPLQNTRRFTVLELARIRENTLQDIEQIEAARAIYARFLTSNARGVLSSAIRRALD